MKQNSQAKVKVGSITKHLPPPEPEGTLIQGRVNPELATKLREKLKKDDVKIVEWMEAAIKAYIDEPSRR